MGKKNKAGGNLGRALIKDRFGSMKGKKTAGESSMLHTAEINDGYDWGRLNLQSVTEESSFQEFLSTAELAGTEFQAEKLNVMFVNPKSGIGLLSNEEKAKVLESHEENKKLLKIPRRPAWDQTTTAYELQVKEKEEFLEWRRQLALLQEDKGLMLTPYEKNLEFWRQLWRVVERSDVVVQIVDARNPLLFRCEDLEIYVNEVNKNKLNMILLNKADFLTEHQRQAWADYFSEKNMMVAFFSATLAADEKDSEELSKESDDRNDTDEESSDDDEDHSQYTSNLDSENGSEASSETEYESAEDGSADTAENPQQSYQHIKKDPVEQLHETSNPNASTDNDSVNNTTAKSYKQLQNSSELLTRERLIELLKNIYKGKTYQPGITTIGLVGYPNVGKSSTINALLMEKKVSVSATPGKTKHFQTIFLEKDLLLCDCPGLVMPSFICTKADMILNGILPIDQMRDHVPAVTLLGTLIPRHIIEDLYGFMLPPPLEGEDPTRPPTAEELLNAYGYNRGFMTQNGQPDNARSARYVLKDYVNGRLLYCVAPPNLPQDIFHKFPERKKLSIVDRVLPPRAARAVKGVRVTTDDLDKAFFQKTIPGAHIRGKLGKTGGLPIRIGQSETDSLIGSTSNLTVGAKPWKQINKHSNKKKREKARRIYAHLDQH
ncbi:large subunit GTPase 1 homolog [Diprion similis]|uniref:large subunit GTPase 1 homolog n=1 Tax=Diprion similis TaxID=362088 RepID=UPI001EF92311|nr:large subunit GTPase 1 homolog [Diprion similis]